jgi:hypothetical protein
MRPTILATSLTAAAFYGRRGRQLAMGLQCQNGRLEWFFTRFSFHSAGFAKVVFPM